jgi:hypothetical protein
MPAAAVAPVFAVATVVARASWFVAAVPVTALTAVVVRSAGLARALGDRGRGAAADAAKRRVRLGLEERDHGDDREHDDDNRLNGYPAKTLSRHLRDPQNHPERMPRPACPMRMRG